MHVIKTSAQEDEEADNLRKKEASTPFPGPGTFK